jgi:hypothetical protein
MSHDIKIIWMGTGKFQTKAKMSFSVLRTGGNQLLVPAHRRIERRFGIAASLNFAAFAILGIFIPFLLVEGSQGETIVQAENLYSRMVLQRMFHGDTTFPITSRQVRHHVNHDFKACVSNRGV